MRVNGIIAEYNPFHKGHEYQLEASKQRTGADYTIVVMSGDFTQRGEPALLSKYARAEMALRCGADLVLELPVYWALGSAEFFAAGGCALLDKLGVVDRLAFGSEWGEESALMEIAELLAREPEDFQNALRKGLQEGRSFPSARAAALRECLPLFPHLEEILNAPNNILGIEYCKALRRRGRSIQPLTVRRLGAGYHEEELSSGCKAEGILLPAGEAPSDDTPTPAEKSSRTFVGETLPGNTPAPAGKTSHTFVEEAFPYNTHATAGKASRDEKTEAAFASALALRKALLSTDPYGQSLGVCAQIPPEALTVLQNALKNCPPVEPLDFSLLLSYRLLQEEKEGYTKYADVTPELSDRIRNKLFQYQDYESFCQLLKTKDMTYTRLSRCLMHILLGQTREKQERFRALDYAPYARILGFRKASAPLLAAVKEHSSIPLVSKLADADRILEGDALALLQEDILASHIYNAVQGGKTGRPIRNEYETPLVIL